MSISENTFKEITCIFDELSGLNSKKDIKKINEKRASELFELNSKYNRCCYYGMVMSNSESDAFGRNYLNIYHDYSKANLHQEMKFVFPEGNDEVSTSINKISNDLYYLYKDSKDKKVYYNHFIESLYMIKYYCKNEDYLKNDMEFFDIEPNKSKIIEKYLPKIGIIYEPKERAVKAFLRAIVFIIFQHPKVLDEIIDKMKTYDSYLVIELFTKKYISKIIDYFSSLN